MRLALSLVFLLLNGPLAFAQFSEGAEQTYLINGLDYSPYSRAILKLRIVGGTIDGHLEPLAGDKTSPVPVIGRNDTEGVIKLTFQFGDPKTIEFTRGITSRYVEWTENAQKENWDKIKFFRPRDGLFSDAALTLVQESCGSEYRTLQVLFARGATRNALTSFINSIPKLARMEVTPSIPPKMDENAMTLKRALLEHFRVRNLETPKVEYVKGIIDVPIGLETLVVRSMRPHTELFSYANLYHGECGGSEISYVTVPKNLLFTGETISRDLFVSFVDARLREFFGSDSSGRNWQFRLEGRRITLMNLPTPVLSFSTKVYAASEITRQVPGFWDFFTVNFWPGSTEQLTAADSALIVEIERLKTVRRSAGSNSPPDASYFRTDLDEIAEAEVTTAVTSYIARHDKGWCIYDGMGYEREEHKAKCEGSRLNDD